MNILIDKDILDIKPKANDGMFKIVNISLALLQVGKDNNLRKLLL